MTDNNKVLIKINYLVPGKNFTNSIQSNMVTEWHLYRILFTAVLLIISLYLLYYLILANADETSSNNVKVKIQISNEKTKVDNTPDKFLLKNISETERNQSAKIINQKVEEVIIKQDKVIEQDFTEIPRTDKTIVRAMLTTDVINREPVDRVITDIVLNKKDAIKLFYFTEIRNRKGQVLYHQWIRNDALVFNREIYIQGYNWRATTSKLIAYSKSGTWKIRLVDENGYILNEQIFKAIKP